MIAEGLGEAGGGSSVVGGGICSDGSEIRYEWRYGLAMAVRFLLVDAVPIFLSF